MFRAVAAVVLIASTIAASAQPSTEYAESIEEIAVAMEDNYVFADKGAECAELIRTKLKAGEYDDLEPEVLAQTINDQLMDITHDLHFGVGYAPPGTRTGGGGGGGGMRPPNHGFKAIEMLSGNVGYLDFRFFDNTIGARKTTDAAMAFLRNSDAIIVDMRYNGGGSPRAVRYICSYFFGDEPVLLNSLYNRATDETTEYWTLEDLPGERMPDVPLYVLTSGNTFSGAEEFSYNLKTRQRATLVGEVTGGGAHPVMGIGTDQGFTVRVPYARAINPITGTNWEGVGVEPDVSVTADKALDTAHMMALEHLSESATGRKAEQLAWAADMLRATVVPLEIDAETLKAYAGSYGPRQVTFRDGTLYYSRDGRPERPLIALSNDTFMIEGVDMCQFVFEPDETGAIARIVGNYSDGRNDQNVRD